MATHMDTTLEGLAPYARDARSWPFEQARALLKRVLLQRLDTGEVAILDFKSTDCAHVSTPVRSRVTC